VNTPDAQGNKTDAEIGGDATHHHPFEHQHTVTTWSAEPGSERHPCSPNPEPDTVDYRNRRCHYSPAVD
jgi:hypothetical protein